MDWEEVFHGFDFEDDTSCHHEVEAVATVEVEAFVAKGDGELALEVEAAECELMREAVLVGGFQKAGSEVAVNLDASADDGLRNPIPSLFLCFSLFHFRVVGAPNPEVAS